MRFRTFVTQRDFQEGARLAAAGREGLEHRRLRVVLEGVARDRGFDRPFSLGADAEGELNPEVCGINGEGDLFVGEAKDGDHEPASNVDSRWRVSRYLRAFAGLIHIGKVRSGVFLLLTNSERVAWGWARELSRWTSECDLHSEEGMGFGVSGEGNTWFVG